jgi:hypothetical protein
MRTPELVVATLVALLLVAAVLVVALRGRARTRRELAAAHAETAELRVRLDALTERLETTSAALVETREAAYLITDAGTPRPEPNVPDRVVLSATVGEPLVRSMAFVHGVARALSPESRNRIWFEVRREVRRARKQRRREVKEALRQVRADQRATDGPAGEAASAA